MKCLLCVISTIKLLVRLRVIVYRYVNFMYVGLQVKQSLKFCRCKLKFEQFFQISIKLFLIRIYENKITGFLFVTQYSYQEMDRRNFSLGCR